MSMQPDTHRPSGHDTDRLTESQSAYIRQSHRDDAEAGDASADVHEVKVRSNQQRRHGDRSASAIDEVQGSPRSAFTRAEQSTSPEGEPDGGR